MMPHGPTFFDLSARVKLRVSGADAARFLNGQVTNDLRNASETRAVRAAILNAKGRMNADVFIRSFGDAFLVDSDASLRESLQPRLDRYIIADNVQVEDVSGEFALFHIMSSEPQRDHAVVADRFATAGHDLWIGAAERDHFAAELKQTFVFCDDECAEAFRIEQGVPRWGRELSDEIIPVEANLESVAIDYAKGCYIGQEVISRMKMSGQTRKRLCGLVALGNAALHPGMRLTVSGSEDVGSITSATRSERLHKHIALGFVKRGYNEIGAELQAVGSDTRVGVQIVPLPFR